MTDYTQVIQNFRLAALEKMQDSEFMKEISDERKTELFDLDDFFWIKDKISNLAEKNGLSFLEQAILIKDNENDYPEFTIDDRRQIRKNLKEKPGVLSFNKGYHGLTHGAAGYSMSTEPASLPAPTRVMAAHCGSCD